MRAGRSHRRCGRSSWRALIAALVFVVTAHVAWEAAGVIAISSIIGGQAGSAIGRHLNPLAVRLVIVVAGLAALIKLLLT